MFIVQAKRIHTNPVTRTLRLETQTTPTEEADAQARALLKTMETLQPRQPTIADRLHVAAAEALEAEAQVQEEAEAMVAEVTEVEAQAQEEADAAK